jgi:glycosyltransferase involved in cell wall biosynthesis
MPKVSVCIPTFNRSANLRHTIQAVLNQTYTDYEILVSDDASVDDSEAVVASFNDPRITYYRNPTNIGLYQNWNRLIELATGEYVAIYHDHDIYLPTILERSVHLLDKYPSANFVHTGHLYFDANKRFVKLNIDEFPEFMSGEDFQRTMMTRWGSPVLAPTAMVRRTAYDKVGLYMPERDGLWCDLDMWFRLSTIGGAAYVREPEVLYRVRIKGQYTAIFKWENEVNILNMKERQLAAHTYLSPWQRWLERMQFGSRRDYRFLTLLARALVLNEPQSVIDDGMRVLKDRTWLPTQLLGAIIVKSKLLQQIARSYFLPRHYEQTWEVGARQASEYLKTHDNDISHYLQMFA